MTSDICIFNMDDELCKYNLTLYAARHELWRTEEKCCCEYTNFTNKRNNTQFLLISYGYFNHLKVNISILFPNYLWVVSKYLVVYLILI